MQRRNRALQEDHLPRQSCSAGTQVAAQGLQFPAVRRASHRHLKKRCTGSGERAGPKASWRVFVGGGRRWRCESQPTNREQRRSGCVGLPFPGCRARRPGSRPRGHGVVEASSPVFPPCLAAVRQERPLESVGCGRGARCFSSSPPPPPGFQGDVRPSSPHRHRRLLAAMSAQAQMRALLDQLMGTARDGE